MRPRQSVQPRRRPKIQQQQLQLGRKHKPDYWLLIWCAALLSIGLIVVYAISPALAVTNHVSSNYYVGKQLIAIVLSIVVFIITAKVPLQVWRQVYKPLLVVAGLATLLALAIHVNPAYPAHRWVRLGSFSFQSVELVKFAGLIWVAAFLAGRIHDGTIKSVSRTFQPFIFALLTVAIVVAYKQSDLGSTGVLVAMMGTMAFVAGLPMGKIALISGGIVVLTALAISTSSYRMARLETFLHPNSNCQGSGYQACQSLISVGSGGIIGLGLGNSVQAYGYEPEAANDSIFAIYAEKFGFIGTVILLLIFALFFTRLKNIAERLPDDFSRLLVVGILAWFATQALINIGGMIGLLPLKGITLPFISYGGTSVIFSAAAVGLVFQASQYTAYASPRITASDGEYKPRDYRNNTVRRANV